MKKTSPRILGLIALSLLLLQCNDHDSVAPVNLSIDPVSVSSGTHNWQVVYAMVGSDNGLTAESHGFVYSKISQPTIEESKVAELGAVDLPNFYLYFDGDTEIEPDTDYYVRAYVKLNGQVSYSEQVQFHSLRGHWKKLTSFPGSHRKFSISYSVGGKVYVVGGISMEQQKFNDVWCFDPTTSKWDKKNNFPLSTITNVEATHFLVNDVAYVVSAEGLWKYDLSNDAWQKMGAGINQIRMMSFTINGKGYAGYGHFDGPLMSYDAAKNSWTGLLKTYPGDANYKKYSWAVNGKAYTGYGIAVSFEETIKTEFYEYDPVTNRWTAKKSAFYYNDPRSGLTHFSVNNKVYVGMGRSDNDTVFGDIYEYDEAKNDWIIIASLPAAPRTDAFSCFAEGKGYVGMGFQYYRGGEVAKLTDFWEYTP